MHTDIKRNKEIHIIIIHPEISANNILHGIIAINNDNNQNRLKMNCNFKSISFFLDFEGWNEAFERTL